MLQCGMNACRQRIVSKLENDQEQSVARSSFEMDSIHVWSTVADDLSLTSWTLLQSFPLNERRTSGT